jgi:hypothetical protein
MLESFANLTQELVPLEEAEAQLEGALPAAAAAAAGGGGVLATPAQQQQQGGDAGSAASSRQAQARTCGFEAGAGFVKVCVYMCVRVCVCVCVCVVCIQVKAGLIMVLRSFSWWQLGGEALHAFVSHRMLLGCLTKSVLKA